MNIMWENMTLIGSAISCFFFGKNITILYYWIIEQIGMSDEWLLQRFLVYAS